ncbi:HNH endonuclease [Pseudoxanthomonas winnipegensis]|nr:HNH endonuclease [Pseudoxanthomonas winnipegensis]
MSRDLISARARRRWTADEDETLRINFPMWPAFLIAHLVGHSVSSVYQRATRLGIEKHPDHMRNPMAHLWNNVHHPAAIASRFKPGRVPANKGVRRPGFAPGRMAETQFRKGRPACEAHNYVPIGTEKIDPKRNALVRKVTDDPSIFPVHRWQPVAKIVWESAHGPVPKGHVVRFRDGMKSLVASEITLDCLELVSQRENMLRNSFHNYPEEVAHAVQLRSVLSRVINRRKREDSPHE